MYGWPGLLGCSIFCLSLTLGGLDGQCKKLVAQEASAPLVGQVQAPADLPPNLLEVSSAIGRELERQVFSGGEPSSTKHFAALKALGIRVVVSVDGLPPNLALAKKHGLKYVHLPLKYSGIDRQQALGLARVFVEQEGGIYVHCHHGKHRAPAAVATMLRVAEQVSPEESLQILKRCGTDKAYLGLWRDVRQATARRSGEAFPELLAVQAMQPLAKNMAEIDRHFSQLRKTSTTVPQRQYAAKLLYDSFKELLRAEKQKASYDEEFLALLEATTAESRSLIGHLESKASGSDDWKKLLKPISDKCTACHEGWR